MDIDNTTPVDTKYKVSGGTGGAGIDPHHHFRKEETVSWPTLRAGSRIQHHPTPPGPWVVCFMVGDHQVVKEVSSASERVTLVQAGAGFRAQVG
jgi:hypothetical protein